MVSSDVAHVALSCLKILVSVGFFPSSGVRGMLLALQESPTLSRVWLMQERQDATEQVWNIGQVADAAILFGLGVNYACY